MKINRHNYEAYLIDLLEGQLSVEDQQELRDFLQSNPDCYAELSELEPWFLETVHIPYPERSALKKEFPEATSILTRDNFDLFSIARMEGDLTIEQERAHGRMVVEDVQKYRQWSEWQHTKLVPEQIIFKDKQSLVRRRGGSPRVIWMSVISAAASLALLVVLFRMDPLSATKDSALENSFDNQVQQSPEETSGPEDQANAVEPFKEPTIRESSPLPFQKPENPVKVSVVKDHAGPPITASKAEEVPKDDLMPRPVRLQDNRVYISSLVSNPVPDRIKTLNIPPASIHLRSLSVAQLSEMDLQEIVKDYREEKDLSFWTIAKAGINGINRIAGSEISLLASRDEEGEVSGFQLKSKRFSVTKPIGQQE
jgi:hypothetical protein